MSAKSSPSSARRSPAPLLLALIGGRERAAEINVGVCLVTFVAAVALTVRVIGEGPLLVADKLFFVDSFNVFLVALTAFVGLTTSIFSRPYMRIEQDLGHLTPGRLRLYHSMFQVFNFTMLLALSTNNMGLLWVAMEAATLTTVLLISLYRTPASLEAAWKYFILCGVGIAQALFGTILLYFAAEKLLGAGGNALLWTELNSVKGDLEPTVLSLAFVFLLVGYGTKVGLVPLHNWLPDAHAEGPTPVSAVLSGLLLNVALYAVVRCKVLVEGSVQTSFAADLDDGLRTACRWSSRRCCCCGKRTSSGCSPIRRSSTWASSPSPSAWAARSRTSPACLHMTVHSLTKSAIFFTVGHATQKAGTQLMDGIRGLVTHQPADRLGAGAGRAGDPRHAAVRRLRQRIPDPDHGDARAAVGDAAAARRARRRVRRDLFAACSRWCSAKRRSSGCRTGRR